MRFIHIPFFVEFVFLLTASTCLILGPCDFWSQRLCVGYCGNDVNHPSRNIWCTYMMALVILSCLLFAVM